MKPLKNDLVTISLATILIPFIICGTIFPFGLDAPDATHTHLIERIWTQNSSSPHSAYVAKNVAMVYDASQTIYLLAFFFWIIYYIWRWRKDKKFLN